MASGTLDIDLDAITANWRALDAMTPVQVQTAVMVKADGYGLGAAPVARALMAAGARRFFVALTEEGVSLRLALGPEAEINILSGHMDGDAPRIRSFNLIPMLTSRAQIERHFAALPGHPFGVQLETGMNRLGIDWADWQMLAPAVLRQSPRLIMSHMACADEPGHELNARQLASFRAMTDGTGVARSFAATGGILLGRQFDFDLTRPGIGLYGGAPFHAARRSRACRCRSCRCATCGRVIRSAITPHGRPMPPPGSLRWRPVMPMVCFARFRTVRRFITAALPARWSGVCRWIWSPWISAPLTAPRKHWIFFVQHRGLTPWPPQPEPSVRNPDSPWPALCTPVRQSHERSPCRMILLSPLAALGRMVQAALAAIGRIALFAGEAVSHLFRPPFYPREFSSR